MSGLLNNGKDRELPELTPLSSLERNDDDDLEQITEGHDDDGFGNQASNPR